MCLCFSVVVVVVVVVVSVVVYNKQFLSRFLSVVDYYIAFWPRFHENFVYLFVCLLVSASLIYICSFLSFKILTSWSYGK